MKVRNKINRLTNVLLIIISLSTILSFYYLNLSQQINHDVIPVKTSRYVPPKTVKIDLTKDHFIIATGEYEPYVYTENGIPKGYEYEMMVAVLDEMGVDYEIQFMSWARGLYLLETGEVFGTFPYAVTEERSLNYIATDSLIDATKRRDYFYYYDSGKSDFSLETMEDLKKYKVGGISGYYYTQIYDEMGLEYDVAIDEMESFNKLKEGRIDTFPLNPKVGDAIIKRYFPNDKDKFKKAKLTLAVDNPGDRLMISKSDPRGEAFILLFNQIFYKLRSNGIIYQYYNDLIP